MARRRVSYAWATHVDPALYPSDAQEGLEYARTLAENSSEWSRQARVHGPRPFPLTPEELAEVKRISASTVRRRIADARFAAFGSLSDSGIYYRLAKAEERRERGRRTCRAPDCQNELPDRARRSRRYCHSRCRRRHHYQRPLLAARARHATVEWEAETLDGRLVEVRRLYGRAYNASSLELHDLAERARLSSACDGFRCFVALGGAEEVIGCAYGRRSEKSQWWWHRPVAEELGRKKQPMRWLADAFVIGELAVAPDVQGRGFGRELLERLLATPEAQECSTVLIVLDATAQDARSFYGLLGFTDILSEFRFSDEGAPKRIMGRSGASVGIGES